MRLLFEPLFFLLNFKLKLFLFNLYMVVIIVKLQMIY